MVNNLAISFAAIHQLLVILFYCSEPWLCPDSTVVEQSSHNPEIKGSNHATGAGKKEKCVKIWVVPYYERGRNNYSYPLRDNALHHDFDCNLW
jgi:hypothetical protein